MSMRRRGFTLIEILVVIGIIGMLLGILLPVLERVRHKGYLQACASNLRSIGQALQLYADENQGAFPRTMYVAGVAPTYGTGADAGNAFGPGGPAANDVTAAAFLLLRTQKMPSKTFICPYNDVNEYQPDPAADLQNRSNFTDYKKNFGYSLANPYPDAAASAAGYKWTVHRSSDFALAADKNPGTAGKGDDVVNPTPTSTNEEKEEANSNNHEKDGQNVLFGDGHVAWEKDVFCGPGGDNIYANEAKRINASPVGPRDCVLTPADDGI